jgi:ATP-dependent DNA helicase RecG
MDSPLNPILVSYVAKGILSYRGLSSGIKRALDEWQDIDFADEREGCLFTVTVHRRKPIDTRKKPKEVGEKLTQNQKSIIQGITDNPYVPARELSDIVGISSRKIEDNIKKLKALGVLKRIGPPKGCYWEIMQEPMGKSE